MLFHEINPFIRYARYLYMDSENTYLPHTPYDARLFYGQDGFGQIEVCGETYDIVKGCALIINSGIEYHIKTPDNYVSYIVMNFDYTQKFSYLKTPVPPGVRETYRKEQIIEKVSFEDMPEFDRVIYVKGLFQIEEKMQNIVYEYMRKFRFYDLKISGLFSEVLIEAARKIRLQPIETGNEVVGRIMDYIHENYAKSVTNAEIGTKFGFHPNYISDMIKVNTGMPLHKYLIHVKISHAVDCLDAGRLSVGEIAEKCGFGDIYYFSRYFKKIMGMTPTEYRRR